jgi:hypothetical protein
MTFVEEETFELEILAGRGAGPCFDQEKERIEHCKQP